MVTEGVRAGNACFSVGKNGCSYRSVVSAGLDFPGMLMVVGRLKQAKDIPRLAQPLLRSWAESTGIHSFAASS